MAEDEIRDKKGRFVKGNQAARGNNGGRPRRAKLQDVIDEVMTDDDLKEIIRKHMDKAKAGDKDAAKLVLEHRYGRPVQETELVGDQERPVVIFKSTVPIPDDDNSE